MKVTTEERPQQEALLNIELEPDDVETYLERSYRKTVKRLNVPGFRKGKAPRRIIEQLYGREYLLNEALDFMLPEATNRALEESSLEVAGVPSIKLEQLDPPSFTATIPLTPKVDLGNYLSLRIPKERTRISKEQVANVVEQLRLDMAPWEPIDGSVAYGDLLNITVRGWAGEEEILSSERADYVVRERSRLPVLGFAEALVGAKSDQRLEFTIEVPEDEDNPQVAGKSCGFEVTVHDVKRKSLPPLDDEFAKGVGEGYETLAALRSKVEEDLTRQEEQASEARYQEQMLDAVLRNATIDFSPLLVDHEVEHQLHDHAEALRTGRVTVEQYQRQLEWAGKSAGEVRDASRPGAEAQIRRALVLREVIEQHRIEVSDDEIKAEVEKLATDSGAQADAVRKIFASEEGRTSLRRTVVSRKAMEMLTGIAKGEIPAAEPARAKAKGRATDTRGKTASAKTKKTTKKGGGKNA